VNKILRCRAPLIGAQLFAAHNAAMEYFRRAMLEKQSFEGQRENLNRNQTSRRDRLNVRLVPKAAKVISAFSPPYSQLRTQRMTVGTS
jgi:hypothetical protein